MIKADLFELGDSFDDGHETLQPNGQDHVEAQTTAIPEDQALSGGLGLMQEIMKQTVETEIPEPRKAMPPQPSFPPPWEPGGPW